FHCAGAPLDLASFPTRRSSDLLYRAEVEVLIRRRKGELKAEELFQLAVLRWDLAKDTDGAFEALLSAARLVRDDGHGLMFHYLRSEEHTSELQSRENLVCRLLL